jgi:hypothetical protein
MRVALGIAAIALAGITFMLRFLIALLREGPPSVCYWVVPSSLRLLGREPLRMIHLVQSSSHAGSGWRESESDDGEYGKELLENENYAKEECTTALIALDVRPACSGLGWRSIHPSRGYVFGERRL